MQGKSRSAIRPHQSQRGRRGAGTPVLGPRLEEVGELPGQLAPLLPLCSLGLKKVKDSKQQQNKRKQQRAASTRALLSPGDSVPHADPTPPAGQVQVPEHRALGPRGGRAMSWRRLLLIQDASPRTGNNEISVNTTPDCEH